MEENPDVGWTKPKQSFRLKKTAPRGRPVLGSKSSIKTLVTTQQVKRRNSFDKDETEKTSNIATAAKKQRLDDIFSASSMFMQNKSLTCPSSLQRRVSECNQSTGSRGRNHSKEIQRHNAKFAILPAAHRVLKLDLA